MRKFAAVSAAAALGVGAIAIASPAFAAGNPTGDIAGQVVIGNVTTLSLSATSFVDDTTPGVTSVSPEIDGTVASDDANGWTATEALTSTFTGPTVLGTPQTIPDPQWAVQNYVPHSGSGDDYTKTWDSFDANGDAQTIFTVPAGEIAPNAYYTNWPDGGDVGAPGQDNVTGDATYGDILFGIFDQVAVPGGSAAGTYNGTFSVVIVPA